MIKEVKATRSKRVMAPNGHHKTLALSFAWKELEKNKSK